MSFRKRNLGIASSDARPNDSIKSNIVRPQTFLPGVRPSPLDGRPTTSTGTSTLDGLLAGHAGLALGSSILIEENGTTDYAGALLRVYAAEGLVQGHHVHVVGLPEHWARELPGLAGQTDKETQTTQGKEKMKIAWRYEGLGRFGEQSKTRGRDPKIEGGEQPSAAQSAFCHTFDLAKRLAHPADSKIDFLRFDQVPAKSPFLQVLNKLSTVLANSDSASVHRVVLPSLLSPALYPPWSSQPEFILQFLHGLRSLLATYQTRMTAMVSLPLSLYPRSSGLVRWIELLNDGVIELVPFPHTADNDAQAARNAIASTEDEPQGLLRLHRLPIFHERGSGNSVSGDDWAFNMSRRKFTVKPFSLPPIEGDTEAQQAAASEPKGKKADLDF